MNDRFLRQLDFIREADKIKSIFRQTYLMDGSRKENDAEHSWHLALMALVLEEYAPAGTDLGKVIRMVLVHDMVEIDAGDTYLFDKEANRDKAEREKAAAERIFGLLPPDLVGDLRGCWEEFEEGKTGEARFAGLLDRFQPFFHNWETRGISWKEHRVSRRQVLERMEPAMREFPLFLAFMSEKVDQAVEAGWLLP